MKIDNLSASPPEYLSGTARYLWRRIVPMLIEQYDVQKLDRTVVESLCINYQIMRLAYESIKESGTQYLTEGGLIKPNPAVSDVDRSSKNIRAACDALGMTPKGRAELLDLKLPEPDDEISTADQIKIALGKKVGE